MTQRVRFLALILALILNTALADITMPRIFSSHMVLQRDEPIVFWGWADPGEMVTAEFNLQKKSATADKNGKWKIVLAPESAGGPYELKISGKNALVFDDIMMGDVWICSGQSNMEWPVSSSKDALKEIAEGNHPTIRHFKVPNTVAAQPAEDVEGGEWEVCSPQTVASFSAVGYFFAREITKHTGVAVGLLNTSWGGTHVETWTSREAFEQSAEFKNMISAMPRLNLDSLQKKKSGELLKKIYSLQSHLPADRNETNSWTQVDFDDSSWRSINTPSLWEGQELGDIDGVVWLRKTVNLTIDESKNNATLALARIDDSDETYVNGVKVGETIQKWNEKRIYTISQGVLRSGMNVITVRVEDTGGGGGIHGDAKDMSLNVGAKVISLSGQWKYQVESLSKNTSSVGPNAYPTLLFNSMISPLLPLRVKGFLWYQGEANAERAFEYRKAFPLMINDWRKHWQQGNIPFYFVQLATFNAGNGNSERGSTWAELREAQTLALSLPNTGMVVTTDIGDPVDIHPANKQDVGKRLAAIALSKTYGKGGTSSGPLFRAMEIKDNKAVISFTDVGTGLRTSSGELNGFEIAGEDRKFYKAIATIENNQVKVFHANVNKPVAVRYNWADDASAGNLFNKEGFPAVPFRTDNWKGMTEEAKFSF